MRQFFQEGRGIFDFGGTVGGFGGRGGGGGEGGGGGGGGGGAGGGGGGSGGTPTLFFSRRIGLQDGHPVPIQGGLRVTGEIGRFKRRGAERSDRRPRIARSEATNFTVVRMKSDVLSRSRIGAIFARRSVSTVGEGRMRPTGSTQLSPFTTMSTSVRIGLVPIRQG